jgi:membrane-associated protease RseP (regulator of RpoE activity)
LKAKDNGTSGAGNGAMNPPLVPFDLNRERDVTGGHLPNDGSGSSRVPRYSKRWLALALFSFTCASTFYVGTNQFLTPKTVIHPVTGQRSRQIAIDPLTRRGMIAIDWGKSLLNGLTYAAAVMLMLAAHEMGHYLQARRYGVPASLPFFIPMPFTPLGTMGAVIVQEAGTADRKSMFDIAIAGPLAGLAVALPLNLWGIQHTTVEQLPLHARGWTNPLIVEWMVGWIKEPLQPGHDIILNPILFAGWVGIFITGLNLIPIGQLDGGHILYCLLGRKANPIFRALHIAAVGFVVVQAVRGHTEYVAWAPMLILVWFMGTQHPPTADDRVRLGMPRVLLGWLTLAFIVVGFVPSPTYETQSLRQQGPNQHNPMQQTAPIQQTATGERAV